MFVSSVTGNPIPAQNHRTKSKGQVYKTQPFDESNKLVFE